MDPAEQFKQMREKLCALFGLDPACSDEDFFSAFDQFIAEATGENQVALDEAKESGAQEAAAEFADKIEDMKKEHAAALLAKDAELETARQEAKEFSDRLGEFTNAAAEAEAKTFADEVEGILDGLTKEGKLPPAEREATKTLLVAADRTEALKFKDGETEKEGTAYDQLVTGLRARAPVIALAEVSKAVEVPTGKTAPAAGAVTPDGVQRFSDEVRGRLDPKSVDRDAKIRDYMAEHKVSYGQAMLKVS